ncbi:MAG TPA: NAD(P)-dependent oxidoreductase, partial [Candidatus Nitrosocosmicus sp.]|nr:NAD(P)-dependent oxidoreductase [Candidatus Nitrosocosmicus sp.]
PKRKMSFKFYFVDWVNEHLDAYGDYDIIIHAGSIYDTKYSSRNEFETLNVNIKGTKNIIDSIPIGRQKKPLFIYLSSLNVLGDQSVYAYDEIDEDSAIPNPKGILNYSLYSAENLLKSNVNDGFDYLILRLGTIVGYFSPPSNLINQAVKALVTGKESFEMYNANESIELVDIVDVLNVMEIILNKYRNDDHHTIKNQVFNLKAEEKEPKTVDLVVRTIYDTAFNYPTINDEHRIPGFKGSFKLVSPKINYMFQYDKPRNKWDVPVSMKKISNLLGYTSQRPLIMTIIPTTVHYLLGYILDEKQVPIVKKNILEKIFGLRSTPSPQSVQNDQDLHNDVKAAVGNTNKEIEKSFEKEVADILD